MSSYKRNAAWCNLSCLCGCKLTAFARRQVSLHRDNKVVLYFEHQRNAVSQLTVSRDLWRLTSYGSSSRSNWILISCPSHRVTSGQSTSGYQQIHISRLFSHIYQPSVKSVYSGWRKDAGTRCLEFDIRPPPPPPTPNSEKWRMVLDGVHCLLGVALGCMTKAFFVFCPRQCTGNTLRLAMYKKYTPCKVQEIHSALQCTRNTLRLARCRKYTPPCKVQEIHSSLQGAGNTLLLARCRKYTPPCKVLTQQSKTPGTIPSISSFDLWCEIKNTKESHHFANFSSVCSKQLYHLL